jgi:hypothetical protein
MTIDPEEAKLRRHFQLIKQIIADQDMLERVPAEFLEFSPRHLEDLTKFAYFGGFIGLGEARQLLLLPKEAMKPRLRRWYEEVREKGCWLC